MAMRKHMPRILRKADNPKGIGIDYAETDLFPDAFIGEMVKDGDGTRAPMDASKAAIECPTWFDRENACAG